MSTDRAAMDREMAVMRLVHEMRGEASAVRRELGEVVAAIERIRALMVRVLVYSAIAAIAAPVCAALMGWLAGDS